MGAFHEISWFNTCLHSSKFFLTRPYGYLYPTTAMLIFCEVNDWTTLLFTWLYVVLIISFHHKKKKDTCCQCMVAGWTSSDSIEFLVKVFLLFWCVWAYKFITDKRVNLKEGFNIHLSTQFKKYRTQYLCKH